MADGIEEGAGGQRIERAAIDVEGGSAQPDLPKVLAQLNELIRLAVSRFKKARDANPKYPVAQPREVNGHLLRPLKPAFEINDRSEERRVGKVEISEVDIRLR